MARKPARPAARKGRKPAAEAGVAEKPAPKRRVGPAQFVQQVRDEGAKVTWTTRQETVVSTIMVLIMVAFASLFFFLVDQAWRFIVNGALNLDLSFFL